MSEINTESNKSKNRETEMNIIAEGTVETPQSDLNRVLAGFSDDGIEVKQTVAASSSERQSFEVQVDEGETLLRFHEACVEDGIVFDIERLYHQ